MKTLQGRGVIFLRGAQVATGAYTWRLTPDGGATGTLRIVDGDRYLEAGETYTLQLADGRLCDFFFTHAVNFDDYTIKPLRAADLL